MVCEPAASGDSRFDTENIARIYRGEQALVGEREVSNVLSVEALEAASYAAQGFSRQEIAAKADCTPVTIKDRMRTVYGRLGVLSNYGLAPYFPLDPDDVLLKGKELAVLRDRFSALEILEALSTGQYYGEIALSRGISPSTARDHIKDIIKIWPGISSTAQVLRVANALRGKYVRAIESACGPMEPEDMTYLTFPRLASLEPGILRRHAGSISGHTYDTSGIASSVA